MEEARKKLEEY